jgi:FAD/FMN-containing dehydrogenase
MIEKSILVNLTGKQNVDDSSATLNELSSDMSFVNSVRPACKVSVKNMDEVQSLVRIARQTRTPLVPVSSGLPHFRGDTVPGTGGAIIVDLSGMKKILHVDRRNRSVMFEPGVTFGELSDAVGKEGMRLNMPLLPRQTKSVLGSLLEREPVIMPKYHWDISDPICCTEVVFGTGDLFRTGAAAGPGTVAEQFAAGGAVKEAAGPSSTSWYRLIQGSQGTMGIVTWISARCELTPKLEEPFLVGSNNLDKIINTARQLIYMRLINECVILNNHNLAAVLSTNQDALTAIRSKLPKWILFFNIAAYEYFSEDRIKGQIRDMNKITQELGVEPFKSIGKVTAARLLNLFKQPSPEPYWKLRSKGGCQDIFYLSLYDRINNQIEAVYQAAEDVRFPASNIGVYLQPIVQGINCHVEFNLFYDPQNSDEAAKAKALNLRAVESLLSRGAFFSRPYGEITGLVMNRDMATSQALKKIKNIMDPDNILNPGKLCF